MPLSLPKTPSLKLGARLDLIQVLRISQVIVALVELGVSASVIHFHNTHATLNPPPSFIHLTFLSTYTLLLHLPYTTFTTRYLPSYVHPYILLVLELLITILWFTALVASAVFLSNLTFCAGLICNNARAAVVFAALLFVQFAVTSWFPVKYCFFDQEARDLGEGNNRVYMGGAQRQQEPKVRRAGTWVMERLGKVSLRRSRDKENINSARDSNHITFTEKMMLKLNEMLEMIKVRSGNVFAEWRMKAGRPGSGSTEPGHSAVWHGAGNVSIHGGAPTQMRQQGQDQQYLQHSTYRSGVSTLRSSQDNFDGIDRSSISRETQDRYGGGRSNMV